MLSGEPERIYIDFLYIEQVTGIRDLFFFTPMNYIEKK